MYPTSVNDQITDAVSQSLATTIGASKPTALAVTQQCYAQAIALGMHGASMRQQQGQTVADALVNTALTAARSAKAT